MKKILIAILLVLPLFTFVGCKNSNLLTLDKVSFLHEEEVEDLIQPLSYNIMSDKKLFITQSFETLSENIFLSKKGAYEWLLISMDNEGQYTFDGLTLTKNIYNDDNVIQSTVSYDLDDSYCSDYGEGLCLNGGGRRLFTTAGMNSIYVPISTPDGITGQVEYIVDSVRYTDKNGKFVNAIKEGTDTVLMYITKETPVLNNYTIDSNYKITLNITMQDDLVMYAINVNNQLVEPNELGYYYMPEELRNLDLYYIEALYEMYPNSTIEGATNLLFSQQELEISTLADWNAIPNEFNGNIILMNDLDISLSIRESFTNSFILNGNYYILSCDHEVTFATGQVFRLKNVVLDFSDVVEPTEIEFIAETEMNLDEVYMLYYGDLKITTLDDSISGSFILTTSTMANTDFNLDSELVFAYTVLIENTKSVITMMEKERGDTDRYDFVISYESQELYGKTLSVRNTIANSEHQMVLNSSYNNIITNIVSLDYFINEYFGYYTDISNILDSYNKLSIEYAYDILMILYDLEQDS